MRTRVRTCMWICKYVCEEGITNMNMDRNYITVCVCGETLRGYGCGCMCGHAQTGSLRVMSLQKASVLTLDLTELHGLMVCGSLTR